jgi:hypothetical protein
MEEAPENGKESSHSAHANGMNKLMQTPQDAKNKNYMEIRAHYLYHFPCHTSA